MNREEIIANKLNLRGADLRRADLYEANLRRADLRRADLYEANLQGTDLQEADLQGTDLQETDFQRADLRGANLYEANLRRADLRGANLRGARGIICAGYDNRGYRFIGVQQNDIPWKILAGCRWFTPQEAFQHWTAKNNKDAIARLRVIAANFGGEELLCG